MLREMRDAAGDSGEFYTPRPVVRFMVRSPTRGLARPCSIQRAARAAFWSRPYASQQQVKTVAHRRLPTRSIFGCEPKSLPYLLCQMNLCFTGLNRRKSTRANRSRFKLTEIGEKDRVDVILTNPPFGGEEEKASRVISRSDRHRRDRAAFSSAHHAQTAHAPQPARAAVVVPNSTLFGDGVCARIKEELLKEFSLHTIVRLPNGVFAPYTGIPTNILFLTVRVH